MIVADLIRKAKHRGQFSMLFFVPGCLLLRIALAKDYPPGEMPNAIRAAYFTGYFFEVVGLVYWILTCQSVYRAISAIKRSGEDIGWLLFVFCLFGPPGAWICGGFLVHQFQDKYRDRP
jgi:hypothetical protein